MSWCPGCIADVYLCGGLSMQSTDHAWEKSTPAGARLCVKWHIKPSTHVYSNNTSGTQIEAEYMHGTEHSGIQLGARTRARRTRRLMRRGRSGRRRR